MSELALKCLRKFLRRTKIEEISSRETCFYNQAVCDGILSIRLTRNEHHNLKMYRIIIGCSISYIVSVAIIMYLDGILRLIDRDPEKDYPEKDDAWLVFADQTLKHIHRHFKFFADGKKRLLGFTLVMAKPTPGWPIRFTKPPREIGPDHEHWRKFLK